LNENLTKEKISKNLVGDCEGDGCDQGEGNGYCESNFISLSKATEQNKIKKKFIDKINVNKQIEHEGDPLEEKDSPYNNIFFHNFENVLIDHIKKIKLN
jgi:hypothetical protein